VQVFSVSVRNELTAEIRTVAVPAEFAADAQIAALHMLFREEGWRKATAEIPAEKADAA